MIETTHNQIAIRNLLYSPIGESPRQKLTIRIVGPYLLTP
jgi:hypothetical protein